MKPRVIEGSTFDDYYNLSINKRADLKPVNPQDLVKPLGRGSLPKGSTRTMAPVFA